jgi:hypothetical protein
MTCQVIATVKYQYVRLDDPNEYMLRAAISIMARMLADIVREQAEETQKEGQSNG